MSELSYPEWQTAYQEALVEVDKQEIRNQDSPR